MTETLNLVKQIEKRIETLDDRMEYCDDIRYALQRSINHLKLSLENLGAANSYPTHLYVEYKKKIVHIYGHDYIVDYAIRTFADNSHEVELQFIYDSVTMEEEKYLSRHFEDKMKQLILKQNAKN